MKELARDALTGVDLLHWISSLFCAVVLSLSLTGKGSSNGVHVSRNGRSRQFSWCLGFQG